MIFGLHHALHFSRAWCFFVIEISAHGVKYTITRDRLSRQSMIAVPHMKECLPLHQVCPTHLHSFDARLPVPLGTLFHFPRSVSAQIYKESAGRCAQCGQKGDQIHHIVPQCAGGSNKRSNAILFCETCHLLWDNAFDKDRMVYPGIPATSVDPNLIQNSRQFKKMTRP